MQLQAEIKIGIFWGHLYVNTEQELLYAFPISVFRVWDFPTHPHQVYDILKNHFYFAATDVFLLYFSFAAPLLMAAAMDLVFTCLGER